MKKSKANRIIIAIRELLVFVLRLYQVLLSPIFSGHCRFVPTCSEYAVEAIRQFGAIKGSLMAVKRIFRCHPFGQCGYDPLSLKAAADKPAENYEAK